jgi:hypothetical protein
MEVVSCEKAPGALHPLRSKVKEVAGIMIDCPNRASEFTGARIVSKSSVKIGQFNQIWNKIP